MTQEKPPEDKKDQDLVKNIFERNKQEPASKKMSSLFGGAPPSALKALNPEKKRVAKELSAVGIEWGEGSIAIIQLGKSDGQFEVIKSASKNVQNVRGSVRQHLSENGMNGDAVIGLSMISPEGFAIRPRIPANCLTCRREPRAPLSAIIKIGLNGSMPLNNKSDISSVA